MKSTFQKLLEAIKGLGIAVVLLACFAVVWAIAFGTFSGTRDVLNEVVPMWSSANVVAEPVNLLSPYFKVVAAIIAGYVALRLLAGYDALPALSGLLNAIASKFASRPDRRPTPQIVSGQSGRPNGHNPSHQNDGNRGQKQQPVAAAPPAAVQTAKKD